MSIMSGRSAAWTRPSFPAPAPAKVELPAPLEQAEEPEAPLSAAAAAVEAMLADLERLPAARPVVLRVLQLVDDPDCSATSLGAVAGCDIALTARLLRLANSAYYGLGGRVTSVPFAITVVGFETVRAIAVAAMTDLTSEGQALPDGFWTAAAYTAVASGAVAGQVGALQPEAFCAGLLTDLGAALLFRADPQAYLQLPCGPAAMRLRAEDDVFGISHTRLGERVLQAWQLPQALTSAIGTSHDPVTADSSPINRALAAGIEISGRLADANHQATSLSVLTRGAVSEEAARGLMFTVHAQAQPLIACLTGE